jgi:hypothetical protein
MTTAYLSLYLAIKHNFLLTRVTKNAFGFDFKENFPWLAILDYPGTHYYTTDDDAYVYVSK